MSTRYVQAVVTQSEFKEIADCAYDEGLTKGELVAKATLIYVRRKKEEKKSNAK
jgi:hypothetical protein